MRTLARINVSPVKGMALHHPEEVELGPAGISENRRFYLVDESGALFSGPTYGPLVRIRPDHDPVAHLLRLTFPDGSEVSGEADALGAAVVTDFYGRPVSAHEVLGPFSDAVSAYVGKPLRLLRCDRDGDGVDVNPLTLVSEASVEDLGSRGKRTEPLDSRRFRINLELAGCEPYDEDSWDGRAVRIGEASVRIDGQIPRCVLTTMSPETGVKDWDTLTQIAKYRPRIGGRGGLPFGVYAQVEAPGWVRLGDTVTPSA